MTNKTEHQKQELIKAIEAARAFESYATHSHYAVPVVIGAAISLLLETYELMYDENYDKTGE